MGLQLCATPVNQKLKVGGESVGIFDGVIQKFWSTGVGMEF